MDNTAKARLAVAAAVAVAAFLLLKWGAGYGWPGSLVLMALVFLLAFLLMWILWEDEGAGAAAWNGETETYGAAPAASAAPVTARPAPVPAAAAPVAAVAQKAAAMPDDPATEDETGPADEDAPGIDDEIAADEALIEAGDAFDAMDGDIVPVDEFMEDGVSAEDFRRYGSIDASEEIGEDTGEALLEEDDNPDATAPETPEALRGGLPRAAGARAPGRTARGAGAGDPRPGPRRGAKKAEPAAVTGAARRPGVTTAGEAKPAAKVAAKVAAKAGGKSSAKAGGKPAAPEASGGRRAAAAPAAPMADDLKVIRGIGPKLEEKLHALGITTFAQVAALTPSEAERIGAELNFRGRIEREDWIGQARILASGGPIDAPAKKAD